MNTQQRAEALQAFIVHANWQNAQQHPLQADASFRRYIRLSRTLDDGTLQSVMVMDAPPPQEDVKPFITVAEHLCAMGLSAPKILQADETMGFLLLEDLGDATFTQLLQQGMGENTLYEAAIDTLTALHHHSSNASISIDEYDHSALMEEALLFIDWYFPQVSGKKASMDEQKSFIQAWLEVFNQLPVLPATLVLRDFHVDNLMLLTDREGAARCGLLDFQDALLGSPAYDVTSLLEDARRDISKSLRTQMLTRYLAANPQYDPEAFMASYRILSAQRHCKIIGIFSRLYERDNKATYLPHIPRVMALLQQHLQHPLLAPIANWLTNHCSNYSNIPASLCADKVA